MPVSSQKTAFRASSKTEQVSAYIGDLIARGQLKPGDRLLAEDKLAEALGISLITVRRGLKTLAETGVIHRVQGSGTFVAESAAAAPLPVAARQVVSLAYPLATGAGHEDPFLGPVMDGVASEALQRGLRLQLCPLPLGRQLESTLADAAEAAQLRGGVIAVNYRLSPEDARRLEALQIPYLQIGTPTAEFIPAVTVDHFRGGFLAALHLLRTGRRRLGVITGNLQTQSYCRDILRGCATALDSWDLPFTPAQTVAAAPGETRHGGELLRALLAQSPDLDAVICYGDLIALDALRALQDAGLRVPGDVGFVAYNDLAPVASHHSPTLTAIHQPVWELGQQAVSLLLRASQAPGQSAPCLLLDPTLIVRESTATVTAARSTRP